MSIRFSNPKSGTSLLFCIFLVSALVRFTGLVKWMYFFGDQAWYFLAARDALSGSKLPLLGITSSITWLHQGPLWTYLIIPVLGLFRYSPIAVALFTVVLNLFTVPLAYYLGCKVRNRQVGLVYAGILGLWYFSVIHSRISYHTSVIPLLFLIFSLLLITGRSFLGGLFLGFLYQSHLLTFIYWPLVFLLHPAKRQLNMVYVTAGFIFGILPFIISGPVQTGGIFIWILSRLFTGLSSVGLISQAYLVVLLGPAALLVSLFFQKIYPKVLWILMVLFFIVNYSYLRSSHYSLSAVRQLSYPRKLELSGEIISQSALSDPRIATRGPGEEFLSSRMPYTFLVWREVRFGKIPSGSHVSFLVDETQSRVRVLE